MASLLTTACAYVRAMSVPLADVLGLRHLPAHADVLLFSALAFWAVQVVLAPALSHVVAAKWYKPMGRRQKNRWNVHIVSLVHALVVLPRAFQYLSLEPPDGDRAFGWDERLGTLDAIACGYFMWDIVESAVHFSDVGFLFHALSCFVIFLLSYKPFFAFYGPRFLLWELSTPFLNIHWFLDKVDMTGSTLQLVNGVALLSTFAGSRLVYGSIMSYEFWITLFKIRDDVPVAVLLVYGVGNVILNILNCLWFSKMIAALRKRMVSPDERPNGKQT